MFGYLILTDEHNVLDLSLVLDFTEKINQTHEIVLHQITKLFEVCQKDSAALRIFNSLFLEMWSKTVFRVSCLIYYLDIKRERENIIRNDTEGPSTYLYGR